MNMKPANSAEQVGIDPSVIDRVPVQIEAIVGVAEIAIGDLAAMKPGDSFRLDTSIADPVELRVNGAVVALGELVTIDGHFGVRIRAIAR